MHDVLGYLIGYPYFCYALYKVLHLPKPLITIFGGRMTARDSYYYQQTALCVQRLAQQGMSVLTGGGPGSMEAGLNAALQIDKKRGLGICVQGVDEDFISEYPDHLLFLRTFAFRKQLLMYYSQAFVVFPGGLGTLDEFAEVVNLIKTNKIASCPVIVFDSAYWKLLCSWVSYAHDQGYIVTSPENVVHVCDTVDDIITVIVDYAKKGES